LKSTGKKKPAPRSAAERELARLRAEQEAETLLFNEGAEAAERGDPMDPSRPEPWQIGYAFFAYDGLVDRCRALEREAQTLASRAASQADLATDRDRAVAEAQTTASQLAVVQEKERALEAQVARLEARAEAQSRDLQEWMLAAARVSEENALAAGEIERLRETAAALERELRERSFVAREMGDHSRHYRALVHRLKAEGKGPDDLATWIGESVRVARALWERYSEG